MFMHIAYVFIGGLRPPDPPVPVGPPASLLIGPLCPGVSLLCALGSLSFVPWGLSPWMTKPKHDKAWQSMPKHAKACQSMPKHAKEAKENKKYQNFIRFRKICWNMSFPLLVWPNPEIPKAKLMSDILFTILDTSWGPLYIGKQPFV